MTTVKRWMEYFGWNPAEAARRLGVSSGSIYRYIKRDSWQHGTLEAMAENIGLTVNQFQNGPPPIPEEKKPKTNKPRRVVVLPDPEEGFVYLPLFDGVPPDFHVETSETCKVALEHGGPKKACVRVKGNGMSPRPQPGDIVLVDFGRKKPKSRDIIAVVVRGKPTFARWVRIERKYELQWANDWRPGFSLEDEEYEILGIAVHMWGPL